MKIHKYQASDEKSVLIGMIVNDRILSKLTAHLSASKHKPFRSRWANLVSGWCLAYHKKYDKAPNKDIVALFRAWAETNEDDDATPLVEKFLVELSEQSDTTTINEDHLLDVAARHFDTVRLEKLNESLESELIKKDLESCRQLIAEYTPTKFATTDIVDVFTDADAWADAIEHQESDVLIHYPNALGEFFGEHLSRDGFISFLAPEKRGKCLDGSTQVQLANGELRTIAELVQKKAKTRIVTLDGFGNFVTAPIAQHWDNGEKECVKITTKTGKELVCTLNHPLLSVSGWKLANSFRAGDFIATPKESPFFGTERMNEEEIRFIAYMLADGCTVSVYDKGEFAGHACSFTKEDPKTVEDFVKCCGVLGVNVLRRGISFGLSGNGRTLIRKHGLAGCYSKTKQIPQSIMRLPKEQLALFLRVFFTCDGSIYKINGSLEISLTLASEKMLRQISHLLMRFGIVHKFQYAPKKCGGKEFDAWKIEIRSGEYVQLFLNRINFNSYKHTKPEAIVSMGRSFLDRIPYEVVRSVWEMVKLRGRGSVLRVFSRKTSGMIREQLRLRQPMMRATFRNVTDPAVLQMIDTPVLWDEIVEIVPVGKRHTYDLGVSVTHNFVAGDVVVHNSFFLIDMAWRSAIGKRRTVLYSVGDMTQRQMMRRIASRATKRPIRHGTVQIPRTLKRNALGEAAASTEEVVFKDDLTKADIADVIKKIQFTTASKRSMLKLRCTPAGSTTVQDISNDLDEMIRNDWVPDVVVIDYADILASEKGAPEDYRHQINETWKALRRMSQKYHVLVVTATQADAASYGKGLLRRENFSEDKRKLAHVTGMAGINQTEAEKEKGIFRLNWILLREGTYFESKCVTVAGCLEIANPCLVSCW